MVGEGSLPGGYTGGGAAGGIPVGVGGCGVETVFFFLPFFLIPLLFVLLGDLESLLEDEDSRCGELEDILWDLLEALEYFLCGETDSLWNESLCLAAAL